MKKTFNEYLNSVQSAMLWFYWLIVIAGLVSSLALLTDQVVRSGLNKWASLAFGSGMAGTTMLVLELRAARRAIRHRSLTMLWHEMLGVYAGGATVFGIRLFEFWLEPVLPYFLFISWIFLLLVVIYGRIAIRRLSLQFTTVSSDQ